MSRHVSIAAVDIPEQREFDAAFSDLRSKARHLFTRRDPKDELTLQFLVATLVKLDVEQKDMADLLGVSRTTIGRWAHGQNIPRSPAFREWAVGKLCDELDRRMNPKGASQRTPSAPSTGMPVGGTLPSRPAQTNKRTASRPAARP